MDHGMLATPCRVSERFRRAIFCRVYFFAFLASANLNGECPLLAEGV